MIWKASFGCHVNSWGNHHGRFEKLITIKTLLHDNKNYLLLYPCILVALLFDVVFVVALIRAIENWYKWQLSVMRWIVARIITEFIQTLHTLNILWHDNVIITLSYITKASLLSKHSVVGQTLKSLVSILRWITNSVCREGQQHHSSVVASILGGIIITMHLQRQITMNHGYNDITITS